MSRWVVLEAPRGESSALSEWEPAGTVSEADSESQAISVARRSWSDLGDGELRAIDWEKASSAQRRDAEEEDAHRQSMVAEEIAPAVAMCMIGLTTALITELPESIRALDSAAGRTLEEPELHKVRLAYLALYYECIYRRGLALPLPRRDTFLSRFDSEFRKHLYSDLREGLSQSEIEEGRNLLNEMLIAFGGRLRGAKLSSSDDPSLEGTLFWEFANVVLFAAGLQYDSELAGQLMVRARFTIERLRLAEILRPLSL